MPRQAGQSTLRHLRVLTWNVFHGRAVPPAGRDLRDEYAAALAGWAWDVALLQELPPWWATSLARACDADVRSVRTSRNSLLPLRRFVADRWPDLIKSNGGGANAILVRGQAVVAHRSRLLRRWPERRVVHAVRLASGIWVANVHCSTGSIRGHADTTLAAATASGWAGEEPLALGGDLNIRDPNAVGFLHAAGTRIDHVLLRRMEPAGAAAVLDRGHLSDHAPVAVDVRLPVV